MFTSPFLPSSSSPPFKSVSSPAFVASPAVVSKEDGEDGEDEEEEWKSKSEAAERRGTKVPGWYASVQMVLFFFFFSFSLLSPDLAGGDDDDDDDGLFSLEVVLR